MKRIKDVSPIVLDDLWRATKRVGMHSTTQKTVFGSAVGKRMYARYIEEAKKRISKMI